MAGSEIVSLLFVRPALFSLRHVSHLARKLAEVGRARLLSGVHHCSGDWDREPLFRKAAICNYGADLPTESSRARRLRWKKHDGARMLRAPFASVPAVVRQLVPSLAAFDLRPPREASPPLRPAILASSLVNSCAVPFWCAARPPFAAIARWACGSIAANPRGVLRVTVAAPRESTPFSLLVTLLIVPLAPLKLLLPPIPLLRPLRSSILASALLAWSAIILLLPRFRVFCRRGCW